MPRAPWLQAGLEVTMILRVRASLKAVLERPIQLNRVTDR